MCGKEVRVDQCLLMRRILVDYQCPFEEEDTYQSMPIPQKAELTFP